MTSHSTKHGGATVLKTSVWSNTVRNYIRKKAGEIETYKDLVIGAQKWCKEYIPTNGHDLTEEGQILLEDPELWLDHSTFLWECHASRKRERTTEDGTFLLHNKGAITSTFTGDWLLTKGESRDKLGEWLKKTQVRHQDQRKMLESIMHGFPSNSVETRSPTTRNQTNVISVKRCGNHKEDSPQREFFQYRH